LVFCCRFHPVEGDGQDTATVFMVVSWMLAMARLWAEC
jgi:hypothetical protein